MGGGELVPRFGREQPDVPMSAPVAHPAVGATVGADTAVIVLITAVRRA